LQRRNCASLEDLEKLRRRLGGLSISGDVEVGAISRERFSLTRQLFLTPTRPPPVMIKAACEVDAGPGAGLIAIRGSAFDAEEEVLISHVSFLVDGVLVGEIPCCP